MYHGGKCHIAKTKDAFIGLLIWLSIIFRSDVIMIVPFIPFKIVSFADCEHLIAFLNDDNFDSVEYTKYKKGPSGEGIEIIITKKICLK